MKKQITMRTLFMLLVFSLISLTGISQVATKAAQDTSNARLSLIKNSSYTQKQKLDTLAQSLRLQATAANQTASTATLALINTGIATVASTVGINTATLAIVKQKNDTLAQSLRVIIANTDSNSVYSARIANAVDSNSVYSSRNNSLITTNTASLAVLKAKLDTVNQNLRYVGFKTKVLNSITTSTTTYTSGDNVGGIITCTNALRTTAGTGELTDFMIWSTETQTLSGVIHVWNASPSGTYTNNAAAVIAGDQTKLLGVITFGATDFTTVGAISVAHIKNIGIPISGQAARSIFYTITLTSTPSWTATTTGMYTTAGFKQD